jgi:hypothetical protein
MRKAISDSASTAPPPAAAAGAVVAQAPAAPDGSSAPATAPTGPGAADQLRQGLLTGIGSKLAEAEFDEAKAWLDSDALQPEEKALVLNGVAGSLYAKDPMPWLDWMSGNLPEEQFTGKLKVLIPQWTNQDFNAVGAWINGQPSGKPKEEAILSFAETLIPHEPEAAERWLESLPESPRKQELINKLAPPPADAAAADPNVPGQVPAAPPEVGESAQETDSGPKEP